MKMMPKHNNKASVARLRACVALLLLCVMLAVSSCDSIPFLGGKKKADDAKKQKIAAQKKQAAQPAQPATGPDGAPVFGEYNDQLIADAELDQFKGQFSADVGRDDPFAFVPYGNSAISIEDGIKENPDLYRVIGTARTTPSGPAALIQMGSETFVVHEGDEIDKATIKLIDLRDVVIEMGGKEFTLSMRTRKRTIPTPNMEGMDQTQLGKLPAQMDELGSLYEEYLNGKYGKEDFFEGEREKGPSNFTDYLKDREEKTYKKDENPF